MALMEKFLDLMAQMGAMKAEVEKLDQPADSSVDMTKLQDQIKALGDERDKKADEAKALRAAIQAHLDDDKADQAKLEEAIKPIEDVKVEAPVPQVDGDKQPEAAGGGAGTFPSEVPPQAPESNEPHHPLDIGNQ